MFMKVRLDLCIRKEETQCAVRKFNRTGFTYLSFMMDLLKKKCKKSKFLSQVYCDIVRLLLVGTDQQHLSNLLSNITFF